MNIYLTATYIVFISQFIFGQFGPENIVSNIDVSVCSAPADIDNDGDLDLIHASTAENGIHKISYYENLGGGIFGTETLISTSVMSPNHVLAGDLDNDGLIDVVSTSSVDGKVAWYKNLDGTNFSQQNVLDVLSMSVFDLDLGDIDNDGDIDIVVIDNISSKWYKNLGGGNFTSSIQITQYVSSYARSIQCIDMNGDGLLDVLTTTIGSNGKVHWVKNNGNGVFGNETVIAISSVSATNAYADDIDADGDADVLICTAGTSSGVYKYYNNGAGVFGPKLQVGQMLSPNWVRTADIDGDFNKEIICGTIGSLTVRIFSGSSTTMLSWLDTETTSWRTLFDVDNDGDIDLVNSGGQSNTLYLNDGTGTFTFGQFINDPFLPKCESVATGDLDGDNDLDIVATSVEDSTSKIVFYKNLGGGNFTPQITLCNLAQITDPRSVFLIDLDGDSDLDILVGSHGNGNAGWIKNLSGLNFGTFQPFPNTDGAWTAIAADMNGDLLPDILLSLSGQKKILYYENLGGGAFDSQQLIDSIPAFGSLNDVYVTDIDNDADLDILSVFYFNSGNSDVFWYENIGNGVFSTKQVILNCPFRLYKVKTNDLDLDGDQDLIYCSGESSNSIEWRPSIGNGIYGSPVIMTSSTNSYKDFNMADIDEDGDIDLILTSYSGGLTNGNIVFYENYGDGTYSGEQHIADLLDFDGYNCSVVDIDGDGDLDVLHSGNRIAWYGGTEYSPFQARGELYADLNQNGIRDTLEGGLNMIQMHSTPQYDYAFSNPNGKFYLYFNDTINNTYTVSPDIPLNWIITSDSASYTFEVNGSSNSIDSLNFGFYPSVIQDSVNVDWTQSIPVCNDTSNYWVFIENKGTTIASGFLYITLDDSISFINSTPQPDSVTGQTIYWSYDSLFFFDNTTISMQLAMPGVEFSATHLNALVTHSSLTHITIDSLGSYTDTLVTNIDHGVFCAFDPNDKTAKPEGLDALGYISPTTEFIDYTVRFQNTGNYPATDVVIKDQLDSNLVWNSITPLAYSHDMNISVTPSGLISFNFPNIQLVDSSVSQTESQGFVKFRIYLKPNLPLGTSIYNTAHIYFDLNPAIITNTKIHTLYDCQGTFTKMIPNNPLCFNSLLEFNSVPDSTVLNWELSSVVSETGNDFSWLADTSGVFMFSLEMANDLCTLDSTFQLNILSEVPINNLGIIDFCSGDSVLVFGEYRNTPGLYYETQSTINGCDSTISYSLIENPLPIILFDPLINDSVCFYDPPFNLPNASPVGGNYSGIGVNNGLFHPLNAENGLNFITYSYVDDKNCFNSDSIGVFVDGCLGIQEEQFSRIIIKPNPFKNITTIDFGENLNGLYTLEILNTLGQVVYENKSIESDQITFNKGNLDSGVYLINLVRKSDYNIVFTKRLAIE